MLKKAAVSFVGLFVVSAGLALATNLPILCNLDYYVSMGSAAISATPRARVCAVKVIFSNGSGTTGRTYSCTISTGQTSCSLTADPSASGVPTGFTPQSAYTASLYYALVVKNASVDAGGAHEALIGLGFVLGPVAGLVGGALAKPLGRDGGFFWAVLPIIVASVVGASRSVMPPRKARGTYGR